jgi:small nuclear ribonucleoprotein (snRNP)-like protein
MSLLEDHLKNMVGKDIVVVMVDGQAFKGKLMSYDGECIVLDNVMEARATDARWREALVTVPITGYEAEAGGGIMIGDTGTSMLKLTTVIIRISHITRVWIWAPKKPEGY